LERKKPKRKTAQGPKHGIPWPRWTGFRGMTVRDWLQLLIVPDLTPGIWPSYDESPEAH
jgi:hypothetical protein